MPTEQEVYSNHAHDYERLIQREDYQNNILSIIEKLTSLENLDVIDLGAGTGRLSRLLAPKVRSLWAFDTSAHMLAEAEQSLRATGLTNWQSKVADHRQIPLHDASVDLVISGWSFCYLSVWGNARELESGLGEIERVLRPGGMVILLETLGTGHESPFKIPHLKDYYAWLDEKGFQSTWIRTDYRFESLDEAVELSAFFFGAAMGGEVRAKGWQVLPECTGVWWKVRNF